MVNAGYAMLAVLPLAFLCLRIGDGVVMPLSQSAPIDESASSIIDSDAQVRRNADGRLATIARRMRAKRAQRRRELKEFKAWLEITANPFG